MNDRTDKTSYKNSINTQQPEAQTDGEDEQLGNSYTAGNSLKRKTKKQKKIDASSTTLSDGQQRHYAIETDDRATRRQARDLQVKLRAIDKVLIDAHLSEDEIESAIEVCKVWRKEGRATQITNQSGFWKAVFVLYLDLDKNTKHSRNPSVTLYFQSMGNNSSVSFRLQLNPYHIKATHVEFLKGMWQDLFSFHWRETRKAARVYRGDEAYDFIGFLDDIVFDRKASQIKDSYVIKTNREGRIQSQYIGEPTAANRGIIYDRYLAELYRDHEGKPIPLNRETATHVLEHDKTAAGTIRVESRRVFDPKLTYDQFASTPSAFSEFNVFDLSRLPQRDRHDEGFMLYVEWVRLRGIHGAKHRIFALRGKTAEIKRLASAYEARLVRCQCEWWAQLDRTQQLGALLKKMPVNKFLKYIGK